MQGIRPHTLTNEELLRYAHTLGPAALPTEWVEELLRRFAFLLDAGK
jgi:hypothetical protein